MLGPKRAKGVVGPESGPRYRGQIKVSLAKRRRPTCKGRDLPGPVDDVLEVGHPQQ